MVLYLFDCDWGELMTGSLKAFYYLIYPCLVMILSFPENFSRKEAEEVCVFCLVFSLIINALFIFFFHFTPKNLIRSILFIST